MYVLAFIYYGNGHMTFLQSEKEMQENFNKYKEKQLNKDL